MCMKIQLSVKKNNKELLGIKITEKYSYVWGWGSDSDSDLQGMTFTVRCQNFWASPLDLKAWLSG